MPFVSDLDTPLLKLSAHDHFNLRDAIKGVLVFGCIGSGKTSGKGKSEIEPQPDTDHLDR